MKKCPWMALSLSTALAPLASAQPVLTVQLPRLDVAEYHRPYVAVWIERSGAPAVPLALWYDQRKPQQGGQKWLRDLRQWWRQMGRDASLPLDGVSGATRGPGSHRMALDAAALRTLPAGPHQLVVEAAREGGGREVVRLPLVWPMPAGSSAQAAGDHEIGLLTLTQKE